eukprot:scaffold10185_cov283-Chaetoceros_neogracile.AAC.3
MDYDAAKSQLLVDCSDYDAMCNLWDDVTSLADGLDSCLDPSTRDSIASTVISRPHSSSKA